MVKFLGFDNVAKGNWVGRRGRLGRYFARNFTLMPEGWTYTISGHNGIGSWGDTNAYGLEDPDGSSLRSVGGWFVNTSNRHGFLTIAAPDNKPYLAHFYCMDAFSIRSGSWALVDPVTSTTIKTHIVADYRNENGFWWVAAFTGAIELQLLYISGGLSACNGVCIDEYDPHVLGVNKQFGHYLV